MPYADSEQPMVQHRGLGAKLIAGPALFALLLLLPTPQGLTWQAQNVAAVTLWMTVWWLTGALHVSAVAILPFAIFPFLGVMDSQEACGHFAHWMNFLMLGGMLIAAAMERWNLHRRIALSIISWIGVTPRKIILGFMVGTAFISMWINNTASAVMMIPVAVAVMKKIRDVATDELADAMAPALMLSVAYAASIGGVGTIIGTAPNGVFVSISQEVYGRSISFFDWLLIGVPMVVVILPAVWLYLVRVQFPLPATVKADVREVIDAELDSLGPLNRGEKWVILITSLTALGWVFRKKLELGFITFPALTDWFPAVNTDATIALMAGMTLFAIPVDLKKGEFVLDMKSAVKIPWDVLFIIGGGVCLANGFTKTGLSDWLAGQLAILQGIHPLLVLFVCIASMTFLTEITSNTATSTIAIPLMGAIAVGMGIDPYALMIPTCISVSMAFMLPVATPPNAVIFGSGLVTSQQMARAGFGLNWIAIVLIYLVSLFITYSVMGIKIM